jgi:hypothetical protein
MSVTRPRFISINLFADACAAVSVLLLLTLLVLWTRSQNAQSDEFSIAGPAGRFHFVSDRGRIIVGVTQRNPRRSRYDVLTLILNPDRQFVGDLNGWAFAAPHWLVGGSLLIVPLWWWIVASHRSEVIRRREGGLCRECGYDLRATSGCCPECGTAINRIAPQQPAAEAA